MLIPSWLPPFPYFGSSWDLSEWNGNLSTSGWVFPVSPFWKCSHTGVFSRWSSQVDSENEPSQASCELGDIWDNLENPYKKESDDPPLSKWALSRKNHSFRWFFPSPWSSFVSWALLLWELQNRQNKWQGDFLGSIAMWKTGTINCLIPYSQFYNMYEPDGDGSLSSCGVSQESTKNWGVNGPFSLCPGSGSQTLLWAGFPSLPKVISGICG